MEQKLSIDLGEVQKTLLLPLWGRAHETAKRHPLLVDRVAAGIVEKLDYDFAALASRMSPLTQTAWIMRSMCVDSVIRALLESDPEATIVNVGCGLDTTFERVDNGMLSWYDVDLPDVISLRRRLVHSPARRKMIASSFLKEAWLDKIVVYGHVLFIAEGILYYFSEDEVKAFLKRLADRFPGSEIVFDVASPVGVRIANRRVIESSGLDEASHLIWGLRKTSDLLSWDPRFELLETLYYFRNHPIGFRLRLAGALSNLLRIQYMVHLKLGQG